MYLKVLLLCLSISSFVLAQENITLTPDDKTITNEKTISMKKGPIEKDILKEISLGENSIFSIKINATNFDRYIRITSYSTNLDFIRFVRDKTNSYITFKTLTAGIGELNFQVDNEDTIIRKYFYTINVTNKMSSEITTNESLIESEDTNATPTPQANNNAPKNILANNNKQKKSSINSIIEETAEDNNNEINKREETPIAKIEKIEPSKTIVNNTKNNATKTDDNPQALSLFNSAEDLRKIGNYKNALNTYSNVITQYPTSKYSIYSYFRIGDIHNSNKDYNHAFETYKSISDSKTANNNQKAAAIYSMGIVKKQENNSDEAMKYFSEVINKYSDTPSYGNAIYEVASDLKLNGKISDGADILEKSINSKHKFAKRGDSLLLLAEIYEKGNNNVRDFQKAYNTYNKYLEEYPTSSQAKYASDRRNFLSRNAVNLR